MTGRAGIAMLEAFAEVLAAAMPEGLLKGYRVDFSRGASYMPRVPWVAICPLGTRVSGGPTIAVCFGRDGEGAVAGLMLPASISSDELAVMKRTPLSKLNVNVDGQSRDSSYNDRFINPREFLVGHTDVHELLDHLLFSIQLYETRLSKR